MFSVDSPLRTRALNEVERDFSLSGPVRNADRDSKGQSGGLWLPLDAVRSENLFGTVEALLQTYEAADEVVAEMPVLVKAVDLAAAAEGRT